MNDRITSDWLDLMLEEIERKDEEARAAREESERRRRVAEHDARAPAENAQSVESST